MVRRVMECCSHHHGQAQLRGSVTSDCREPVSVLSWVAWGTPCALSNRLNCPTAGIGEDLLPFRILICARDFVGIVKRTFERQALARILINLCVRERCTYSWTQLPTTTILPDS